MGFFDLLNPLFDLLDGALESFLTLTPRLVFWAVVGGAASMFTYRLVSGQDKLAELKPQLRQAQKNLAEFDGELDEILPLLGKSLALAMRQFSLALGPALLASIPLLFLLVWMSNRYDLIEPVPGETITVSVIGEGLSLQWNPIDGAEDLGENRYRLRWPSTGQSLTLSDANSGETVWVLPGPGLSPVVHPEQWWNSLFANPAGYLADDSAIQLVELQFRQHQFLGFGPGWMRGWEFLFISLLFIASIAIKVVFRIH
jgi:hypothetical protein